MEVIAEEKAWAEYLFKKGVVIGLNAAILSDFVDYTAFVRLKDIGIKYLADHPKTSPIPWFNKHLNIGKKQTALQENESTNYVIGAMSADVAYDELPDL
jgi:ribonucleoside-diphosphate reductase beta chain